jgi:putative ABC transport system ATP-binding protein
MSDLVTARGLWKTYRLGKNVSVDALRGLDVSISEKEFVSIIGPSGSGKSTLLNLIGCLDTPSKGELIFDGKNTMEMNDKTLTKMRSEKIGFVFQTFNLLPALTALGNVEFPMRTIGTKKRLNKPARIKRAEECLKIVGLEKRFNHLPSELSGGERQRVAIARALTNNPKLILADEPTGNLDSLASTNIIELLHEVNDEGRTVIMVSHDMETTKGTKILRMKDGVIEDG